MEAPWKRKQLLFVLYSCGDNLEIVWELKHKYKKNIIFSPKTWFLFLALIFFLRNKNNYKGTNTMRNKLWGKTPYSLLGHFFFYCIGSKSFSNGTKSPKILKPVTLLYSNYTSYLFHNFFFFLVHRLISCFMACGIFLDQGLNLCYLALAGRFFTTETPGKPLFTPE